MRVFSGVLLLVSTAIAYQVTSPNGNSGWTTSGSNAVVWERVDTDPTTFAIFLTNVNNGNNAQLLDSSVDGSLGSLVVNPPSGGWVTGSGYRVNFAQDADHPDSLLAQSPQFSITSGSTSQSASSTESSSSTASGSTHSGTSTTTGAASVNTATSSLSSSATSTTPTGTNAAPLRADTPAGFLTAVAAVAAFFTTLF